MRWPVMVAATPATAAASTPGLSHYERGQLMIGCYQARATAATGNENVSLQMLMHNMYLACMDRVEKLP